MTQLLVPALTAVFMLGMAWLRARLHYARSGGSLRLSGAGLSFFAGLAAALVAGWWLAPPLGRTLWPGAASGATLARILWCLAVYYLAVALHRVLRSAGLDLFRPADPT